MTRDQMESFREQLIDLADRMRLDVKELQGGTRSASGGQGLGEMSNAPLHLGDAGTEEYLHDLNAALLEHEEFIAGEVLAALRRVRDGSFGRCERCGEEIVAARLRAIPYTRHCVPCAEAVGERPPVNMNEGRPVGPADTIAPEGEMGESRRPRARRDEYAEVSPEDTSLGMAGDTHAAGTPGGGTAVGGLAGSNEGHGDPNVADLEDASGSGQFDTRESGERRKLRPRGGRAGGAVGGTPAGKRAR